MDTLGLSADTSFVYKTNGKGITSMIEADACSRFAEASRLAANKVKRATNGDAFFLQGPKPGVDKINVDAESVIDFCYNSKLKSSDLSVIKCLPAVG